MFWIRMLIVLLCLVVLQGGYAQEENQEKLLKQAQSLNQQVVDYYHQGKNEKALSLAKQVINISDNLSDKTSLIDSFQLLAHTYFQQGEYEQALPLAETVIKIHEATPPKTFAEDTELQAAFAGDTNLLAWLYYWQGKDRQRTISLIQRALKVADNISDNFLISQSIYFLAKLYHEQKKYKQATKAALQALEIELNENISGEVMVADISYLLAELYYAQGEYNQAVPHLNRALKIFEKFSNNALTSETFGFLAKLYYKQEKYSQATHFAKRALTIANEISNQILIAHISNLLGTLYYEQEKYKQALSLTQRSLEIAEKISNKTLSSENATLLASIYMAMGDYKEAKTYYKLAWKIDEEELNDYFQERLNNPDILPKLRLRIATDLDNMGSLYEEMGIYPQAILFYQDAMKIRKKILAEEHPDIIISLNNLADIHRLTGNYTNAEEFYQRALKIRRKTLKEGTPYYYRVAISLHNLGKLYYDMADYALAKSHYQEAEKIYEKIIEQKRPFQKSIFAKTLNALGGLYHAVENYALAEEYYHDASTIYEDTVGKEHPDFSNTQNNLALLYRDMGAYAKADHIYQSVLKIYEKSFGKEHPSVATLLNNQAGWYYATGNYASAEPLYLRSLEIRRKVYEKEHHTIAQSLSNLAELYRTMNRYPQAQSFYQQAIEMYKKTLGEEHPDVAILWNNWAVLYKSRGKHADAKRLYQRALLIAIQNDTHYTLRVIQGNLSNLLIQQDKPHAAIFWSKQSVNALQGIRLKIHGMEKILQKSFLKEYQDYYKLLIGLLLAQNRTSEAQQVITMYKEKEYYDFIQRDPKNDPRSLKATYTDFEKRWDKDFEIFKKRLAGLGEKRNRLKRKSKIQALTETEKQSLETLAQELRIAKKDFYAFLDKLEQAFKVPQPVKFKGGQLPSFLALQKLLKRLGKGVVLVEYLVTEDQDQLYILLTTPDKQIAHSVPVIETELNQSIGNFRGLMREKKTSINPILKSIQLYNWIIKPIANDLKHAKATTLMLSLDGKLRYLPIAALYDAKKRQYLVEQYTLLRYTQGGKPFIERFQKSPELSVVGLGVSEKIEGFKQLHEVETELEGIVYTDEDDEDGVIEGSIYLDQDFNTENLHKSLQEDFPLMHIASHFVFGKNEWTSFLLLGKGKQLTLNKIRKNYQFENLELLTLSACETMKGDDTTGKEIDGLGVIVQDNGAKSVIATLWQVYDDSTAEFMQRMYKLQVEEQLNKAQALRQTQKEFIEEGHYAHPYFWAPFILMGNGFSKLK